MKITATAILRNLSQAFWEGNGDSIPAFKSQPPADKWVRLNKLRVDLDKCVSIRIGHCDSFRDKVDLNSILKGPHSVECTVEPRRGYKLATFTFSSL